MSKNKRPKRQILRILFSFFCFLLLALLLYSTQFFASFYLYYDNARTELEKIREVLSSQMYQDEIDQSIEGYFKQDLQKASLLLSNQELSNEKLAATTEYLFLSDGIVIFKEDGTPLYTYGETTDNPEFLSKLGLKGHETDENGFPYWSVYFQNGLYLAVTCSFDLLDVVYPQEQYDLEVISALSSAMTNDIIVTNKKTQRLLYAPDSISGKNLSQFLLTPLDNPIYLHIMMFDDSIHIAVFEEYRDYMLLSAFKLTDIVQSLNVTVVSALLGFGFLMILLLAYTHFIRIDMSVGRLGKIHYVQIGKKRYLNTILLRKLTGFALIGISCMICITYCLQLMIRSEEQRQNAEARLDIAARALEENQTTLIEVEKQDTQLLIDTAKELQSFITFNPTLFSEDGLNALSRLYGIRGICLLNEAGKIEVSSTDLLDFVLSNDTSDDTYPFWNVISGFEESYIQLVQTDPENPDNAFLYIGIADHDRHGMLLFMFPYNIFKGWQQTYSRDMVLQMISLDNQSFLLAAEAGTTTCAFDSSNRYTGMSLDTYGLEEEFLRNGYSGTHDFASRSCLITTRTVLDWNLIYITPTEWISVNSWFFTLMVILTGLLVSIIMVMPALIVASPGEDLRPNARKERSVSHRSHIDAIVTREGIELVENQVEHHTMQKRWWKMNAIEKLCHLIRIFMLLIGCSLPFLFLFGMNNNSYPLIDMLLERGWDKSLNVYAISYVSICLIGIWFVAKILQSITVFVTGTFSRRWKTLGILISNIIRYAALIISLIFTLQNFGVQTNTLITSASVLTLVFGLGCQSFVADMVAGVFLIFEGTFRVGDIVTVDNWRGEVVEIGLRSTNVKNELGNIKVFQNSRISGAINMTRDLTYAVCDIILPPGEPLEAYEKQLTEEFFPMAKEHIHSIRQPLVYEGVIAMNGDSATLRISVKCFESEREQIRRDLYRTLKLWREQKR